MGLILFGAPELSVNGERVRLKRRKSLALLSYLALSDRPRSRDYLAAMLWPDSDTPHALASLRLALHDIATATECVAINGDLISFRHDRCDVDVLEFQKLTGPALSLSDTDIHRPHESAVGALQSAADLYTDEFLRGFSLKDAPRFDDWLFFTAEQLQVRHATALRQLVDLLTPTETTAAIKYAQQLVALEPLDEDHHRLLVELYVTEGRYSAAIRQFEKCREVLERELQETPSADLEELYQSLKGKADVVQEPTERGSGHLRRVMAIMPDLSQLFTTLSDALRVSLGRGSYAALGLAAVLVGAGLGVWSAGRPPEIPTIVVAQFAYDFVGSESQGQRTAVATTLTRFIENELIRESGFNVRSARTPDAGGTDELVEIAREEQADFVLHGSVLDDGTTYTVTVQLLDRWSREILMGEDFSATYADLAIELTVITDMASESIYRQIGPEMTAYLTGGNALLNPYCETATVLMSYHMWRTLSDAERAQLYSIIKENLMVDEYLREGYFIQSDWYWAAAVYGVMPPDGAEELLRIALEYATESEQTPEFSVSRGIYALIYEGDLQSAAGCFADAYAAQPFAAAARWWALTLAIGGQVDEGLRVLDGVEVFAPTDPALRMYQASLRYLAGDYTGAIAAAEESINRNDRWIGLTQKGQALVMLDRLEEAVTTLEQAVLAQSSMQAPKAYLAYALAKLGRQAEAREVRASMRFEENDDPSHSQSPAFQAVASIGLDDTRRAREELSRAVEQADPTAWLLIYDPILGPAYDVLATLAPVETVTLQESP